MFHESRSREKAKLASGSSGVQEEKKDGERDKITDQFGVGISGFLSLSTIDILGRKFLL